MTTDRSIALRYWTARTLIAGGVLLLAWVVVDSVRTAVYQREYVRTLHSDATPQAAVARSTLTTPTVAVGDPIGWLEIPRLRLSGAIVHGDADQLLKTAIGHLPDTPLPWNEGNSALAAHRDSFFRPLRHVRRDDLLRLKTPHGEFEYRVRETFIVDPEDLWVLDPTPATTLTLITCYPFNYIGDAPRRFIVRAERIETAQAQSAHGGSYAS